MLSGPRVFKSRYLGLTRSRLTENRVTLSEKTTEIITTFEASKDAENSFLLGFPIRKAVLLI